MITVDAVPPPHLFDGETQLYMETLNRHGSRYMEYGMGGSTLLAARDPARHLVAVDSDPRWLAKIGADQAVGIAVRDGRAALLHVNIGPLGEWGFPADHSRLDAWPDYVRTPWLEWDRRGERPTLVFVDGRFRVACCLAVAAALGAWRGLGEMPRVLLHDFNAARPFYCPVLDFFTIEAAENTLCLLRIREDVSPISAMATMMGFLSDPR